MLTAEENAQLTRVGPGTLMGDLMRHYWIPVVQSSELIAGGRPKRVRLLGEDLVAFRDTEGRVVGFVNLVSDGGDHAFLVDTKTHGAYQRKGIGTRLVKLATQHAKVAGCEWLHVDFDPELASFYFGACGFRPTDAGLIHLPSFGD